MGGGGLHFFLDYVRPTQTILDGPLPPGMIPPVNTSTFAFVQAGGPAWSNAVIQNLIKNDIENYIGNSQTPAERGTNGPETITQNQDGTPEQTALPMHCRQPLHQVWVELEQFQVEHHLQS